MTISPHAVFLARAHRAFSHSCDKSPTVAIIPSVSKAAIPVVMVRCYGVRDSRRRPPFFFAGGG